MPRTHYCLHWSLLTDGVFCAYCLRFFYANRRLPTPADK
jgi:hypothetical protein